VGAPATTHPPFQPLALFHLETGPAVAESPLAMPLHLYAPARPPCKLCGPGFEHRAAGTAADLAECPTCGQPVVRQTVQPVHAGVSPAFAVARARAAGFAVLRRTADGTFEKQ
jgi:hypothetical protein